MPHLCVALKCVLELCIGRVSDLDSRVRIPPVCVESATNRVVCVTEPCVPTSGDVKYSIWAYKGRMATVSGVHCR